MVLEIVAMQIIYDGWDMKNYFLVFVGIVVLVFDVVSDLVGIPT